MNQLGRQAWRFILVGGSNTVLTAAAFVGLAQFMDPRLAYTLVFAAGLAFTTLLTGRYVFSAQAPPRRLALFVGWYLCVYALGLGTVQIMRQQVDSSVLLAVITVLVTAPVNFIGGRLIFGSPSELASANGMERQG